MIEIRDETPADSKAVRELTTHAFAASEYGHNGEAELVEALRDGTGDHLSMVAWAGGQIVGHVLFTPVVIRGDGSEWQGMGLGPLSVLPTHQRQGIGSSLVRAGLDRLFAENCPFVVVLGDPEFYSRFGFQPASALGFSHGFTDVPQDALSIKFISHAYATDLPGGRVVYQPQFGPQHNRHT